MERALALDAPGELFHKASLLLAGLGYEVSFITDDSTAHGKRREETAHYRIDKGNSFVHIWAEHRIDNPKMFMLILPNRKSFFRRDMDSEALAEEVAQVFERHGADRGSGPAKPKSRSFRISTLFFLTAIVALLVWLISPAPEDRFSEQRLIGKWEARLTEERDATTVTRITEWSDDDRVGRLGRMAASRIASVTKHYWCVRKGIIIEGFQKSTPREIYYRLNWADDDNFVLEFNGLDGNPAKAYYRRLKSN